MKYTKHTLKGMKADAAEFEENHPDIVATGRTVGSILRTAVFLAGAYIVADTLTSGKVSAATNKMLGRGQVA